MGPRLAGTGTAEPGSAARDSWFGRFGAAGLASLCPLLAGGRTLLCACAIAAVFALTVCASSVCVAWLRRLIARETETVSLLLIGAVWAGAGGLALQAGFYPVQQALGIYVPLIAANNLLLMQLEERALLQTPRAALGEALGLALRAVAVMVVVGAVREFASAGRLLSDAALLGVNAAAGAAPRNTLPLVASAAGVPLVLSLVCAAANRLWPGRAVT